MMVYFCLDFVHYPDDSFLDTSVSFLSEKNESVVSRYIQIEKNETNVKNIRTKSKSCHRNVGIDEQKLCIIVCSQLSSSLSLMMIFLANDESQVKMGEELLSTLEIPSVLFLPQHYQQ